jgi:hypothetical protein
MDMSEKESEEKDWIGIVKDFASPAVEELKDLLKEKDPIVIISFPAFGVMFEHVIEVIKDHENIVEETIRDVEEGKITTAEIICAVQERLEEKLDRNVTVIIIQKGCSVAVAFL